MKTIRFLAGNYAWPWARQTPNDDGVMGNARYLFGPGGEPVDWLVVYDEVPAGWDQPFDAARSIFVASEPVNVKRYHPEFLAQFGTVLTTDRETPHPSRIFTQLALPWHVGMRIGQAETYGEALRFADFAAGVPEKTKLCSVICSNKAFTPQHRQRLAFVEALKAALGDRVDVYGRGFRDMADKDEALAEYRYHIALENCSFADYWTEKLADPYLRGCYPIYWGPPNIGDYFAAESMMRIDIARPDEAIATIAALLDSDADREAQPALDEARRRVLWEHNLFALLDRVTDSRPIAGERVTLRGEAVFRVEAPQPGLPRRIVRRLRREAEMRLTPQRRRAVAERMRIGAQYLWDWAEQLSPLPVPEPCERDKLLAQWHAAEGDRRLRQEYPLAPSHVVFDVGGYEGQWASDIVARYGCRVHVFEPVPDYAEAIVKRFAANPAVTVHAAALGAEDGKMAMAVEGDASSQFGLGARRITVPVLGMRELMAREGIGEVALLKLNIEGGEYALLEGLLEAGLMGKIRDLQVQFHDFAPDAGSRMRAIQHRLAETHEPTYAYPFLWENWRRKGAA